MTKNTDHTDEAKSSGQTKTISLEEHQKQLAKTQDEANQQFQKAKDELSGKIEENEEQLRAEIQAHKKTAFGLSEEKNVTRKLKTENEKLLAKVASQAAQIQSDQKLKSELAAGIESLRKKANFFAGTTALGAATTVASLLVSDKS